MKKAIQNLWYTYKSEVIFGLVLTVLLIASAWISHLIPERLFDPYINPSMSVAFAAICFFGAALCIKHNNGIRVRKIWATMLIAWGIWELTMVVLSATADPDIMQLGTDTMNGTTMILACFFAWLLFIPAAVVLLVLLYQFLALNQVGHQLPLLRLLATSDARIITAESAFAAYMLAFSIRTGRGI